MDDLGSVMFEPSHDFMESHGLAVAHAVVGEDNEDIVVQILNPTPYSVQVQQGSRIGCLRPLLDVCAIKLHCATAFSMQSCAESAYQPYADEYH